MVLMPLDCPHDPCVRLFAGRHNGKWLPLVSPQWRWGDTEPPWKIPEGAELTKESQHRGSTEEVRPGVP